MRKINNEKLIKAVITSFLLAAFLGTIYEETLNYFTKGYFISKNTIFYGPFNPVYGLGIALLVCCFKKKNHNFWSTWFLATIITGLVEYFTSFILEVGFGVSFWDYHSYFTNIHGRTTIIYAIGWGLGGAIFIKWLYPFIYKWMQKIPHKIGNFILTLLIIFVSLDMRITYSALWRMNLRNHNINHTSILDGFYDKFYSNEKIYKLMPSLIEIKKDVNN